MFVLVLLVTAAYQGYFAVARGREMVGSASETDIQNMAIMYRIAQDLRSAYIIQDAGRSNAWPRPGGAAKTYFICSDIRYGVDDWDKVEFTSLSHTVLPSLLPDPVYESELAEVSYEVKPGEIGETGILVRREIAPLGAGIDVDDVEVPIAEGVVGFNVQCFNRDGEAVEDWDSRKIGGKGLSVGLPSEVGFTLTTRGPAGDLQVLPTKVRLVLGERVTAEGS